MQPAVLQRDALLKRKVPMPDGVPATIVTRIASHASAAPNHLAIADDTTRLTYAQLDRQANQLASHLRSAGAGPELCVGLFLERSTQFIVAALAVMKTGAAYLPLDPSTPLDRVSFILTDAEAPIVITQRNQAAALPKNKINVIEMETVDFNSATSPVVVEPALDSLAYVVYTSGSTGQPKGVEITHANLLNLIDWHQNAFNVTADDRASQVAGFGFDATAWEIWPYLTAGATILMADEITRRSPQALRDWIIAQKITIGFVPTILAEQLVHANWPQDTALRTMLTGADILHRRPVAGLPFVLVNNYGPSECTVVATSCVIPPDTDSNGPPPIGRAISNTIVLILDDALRPVPTGESGELCLAGALVGRGYRNRPELTASRFVTYTPASGSPMRIYRTGDRARVLLNGDIAFLGRLDDQVKIRGYRIELGEIVASLDRHLGIEASAVIVRDIAADASGERQLVAYIVPKNPTLTATDLREFLASRLPDYMIPAHFVKMESLPVTANGKLDKTSLPAPTAANLLPSAASAPPAATLAANSAAGPQEKIAALVASLVGKPSINVQDNFFMIGGHSLLGVQLTAKLKEMFGVKITLRQLFNAPTVIALSAEVARLTATAQ